MIHLQSKPRSRKPKNHFIRRTLTGITAALLTVCSGYNAFPSQVLAEKADVSIRNWYSYPSFTVPELKPTWTVKVDNYLNMNETSLGHQAVAEEGKVFAFSKSKLIALDAATGKQLWTFGNHLTPSIVYDDGILYGLSSNHKPYAVNAKTGKAVWQSGTSTWIDTRERTEALVPAADTLYVIKGSTTFAFERKTGKLRWKADEAKAEGNGTAYLQESDGVVLRTFFVQGALTSIQLNAYDKETGKKLWSDFGQGEAIQIKGGLVYSVDYYSPLLTDYESVPDRKLQINAYNLKTGATKGTLEFNWKMPGDPPYDRGQGSVLASGGKLYVEQGDQISEYNLDTYKTGDAPSRTFQRPYGVDGELMGIVQERLIYRSSVTEGELTGIKLVNGSGVQWNGDAPVSQVSMYGKGVYRAQRNGTLLGIHMLTSKPVFSVKTGADLHEATLKTNGMIIIQAEDKLIGVKLPASLK
ncbi:PQQ-binding-like beta-propeller repeat protein [Paenibacillus xylanilyticus]|uniref:outer membrane protein assembly factor BamB family protein n=1 Tax=Paenibacillus xylanilyticus TaxID=248903 RepID=UPI0039A139A5